MIKERLDVGKIKRGEKNVSGAGEVGEGGQGGPWPPNKIFNDAFFCCKL